MWRPLVLSLFLTVPATAATYFVELREGSHFRAAVATNVLHEYSLAFRGIAMELPDGSIETLRHHSDVIAIHKDHPIHRFEPVSTATASAIIDARARVHASALPARGKGIVVAVIDSGIDATHPALNVAGGYDFAQNDPIPEDVEGHGTHVAGIIAANGAEIVGVAPEVTLLAYKVVHVNGDGKESSLVAALERAIDPNGDGDPADHVDVVNISLGWDAGPDSIGSRAVDAATAAGIVVVVAAGNERRTPAQVKAPGVAPTAITVANAVTETEVILESSRGPTPGTLAFKPDLAAPGENIVSTFRNGGLATLSGTSMASPHVAGAAALLRELHPDWSPADVKAALVSTTRAMNGQPFARGAGFIDVQAAHEARFVVDQSGLSFGVNGAKSGAFDATRTFTVSNRSQASTAFNATAQSTPAGAAVTITPSSFTLAPGTSRSVSVRVTTNNPDLAFPTDSLIGGTIRLQSAAATLGVPWGLVRTARATLIYDGAIATLFATSSTRPRQFYQYAPNAAEMYAPPGDQWDVVLLSDDARVHVAERVRIDDDEQLVMHAADANRTFTLDARDATGTPLHTLPQHTVALRMRIDGSSFGDDTLNLGNIHELRVTPHSSRFHFAPLETQLDASHAYGVMYPELSGDGATLTENTWQHTRLRWTLPQALRAAAHVAYESGGSSMSTIQLDSVETGPVVDAYLSPRTSIGSFAALSFDGAESLALLRATSDGIAHGNGRTLPPVAYHAVNGSEIAIGRGAAHPFGLAAYLSGFGETRVAEQYWQLFDASGSLVASGTTETPQVQPRFRYVATNNVLRGELEVVFGDVANDLIAPTFTSLRVLDATGALTERLAAGEAGALRFSAADFAIDSSTRPTRPERTRVSYRIHGAGIWSPLQVVIEGSEPGSPSTLGHLPSGDIYRVDLSPASVTAGLVDLRIELEDAAGNRTTWTQSPAFAVGNAVAPPRRRAVRR
jgi:subtilisin family serine protease